MLNLAAVRLGGRPAGRPPRPVAAQPRWAVAFGAVAPDAAWYLLCIGGFARVRDGLGWSRRAAFRHLFDDLYSHDPGWIATHQTLHSPLAATC